MTTSTDHLEEKLVTPRHDWHCKAAGPQLYASRPRKPRGLGVRRAVLLAAVSILLAGIANSQEPALPRQALPNKELLVPNSPPQPEESDPEPSPEPTLTKPEDGSLAPPKLLKPPDNASPLKQGSGDEEAELRRCLQKLRAQREALAEEHDEAIHKEGREVATEDPATVKLRVRVAELLTRLNLRNQARQTASNSQTAAADPIIREDGGKENPKGRAGNAAKNPASKQMPGPMDDKMKPADPIDSGADGALNPVALAHVLYKAGNNEQALKTYQMVNLTGMKAEERAPIQYMTAVCLRKLGKTEEAMALFREVANTRGDDQTAAVAQWQLIYLRWRGEFEAQLRDLQARRRALEGQP